jgi:hypothetical protein
MQQRQGAGAGSVLAAQRNVETTKERKKKETKKRSRKLPQEQE